VTAVCRDPGPRLTFRQVAASQYMSAPNGGARKNPGSWASSAIVRQVMQSNRSRDTRPELILRSSLHRQGLRFKVAARPIAAVPITADLVFAGVRVAVFFNGCFWHACPSHAQIPNLNSTYWGPKITATAARDASVDHVLRQAGWRVIRVWEHDRVDLAVALIARAVRNRHHVFEAKIRRSALEVDRSSPHR